MEYEKAVSEFCRTLKGFDRNCWLNDFLVVMEGFAKRGTAFCLKDVILACGFRGVDEQETSRLWRYYVVRMQQLDKMEVDDGTYRFLI